jgi:3-oxoacyl-[acyl-carrier-protein] synthase-3
MSTYYSYVRATGMYVPPKVVTNHDLAKVMDTSDEWIVQRTGIKERRFAEVGVTTTDLALKAVENMLDKNKIKAKEIDCIIFSTLSPDVLIPGSGVILQDKLGLGKRKIPCYDIRQQCSNFVYGLQMADSFIRTGLYENILIVGVDLHSHALDMSTRGRAVSVLFGDGAGCCVVSRTEKEESRILHTKIHADGRGAFEGIHGKLFDMSKSPVICYNPSDPNVDVDEMYVQMPNPKNLFVNAVRNMVDVAKKSLKELKIPMSEVKYLLPHQANMRINQMVADYLKIDKEKVLYNIQKYGNTTSATLPTLLDEFVTNGTIQRGDLIILVAFGSGFTWGSTIMRY